ncbi:MAG: NifB/NifX family molybdenum-iron cluster-binding protein [Bacillota bacterium]
MKIAIASDKKKVAQHFGHCEAFECFTTDGKSITGWETIMNPGHKPGFLPNYLHEKGVEMIIAGGMGQSAADLFNNNGIKVVCGASGPIEKVAESYVDKTLQSTGSLCEEHNH